MGFDDFLLADVLQPGVTVVAQNASQLGHVAVQLLFERINGDASPSRHVVIEVTLIPRGTGEIPVSSKARSRR